MENRAKPGRGRPRVSSLSRGEQLRRAKQRERHRAREAGYKTLELRVPEQDAERLRLALKQPGFRTQIERLLPDYVVDLQAWPALRELAWNRKDRWVPAPEALALYERNWRLVDVANLDKKERDLIDRLRTRFGGGHLNV